MKPNHPYWLATNAGNIMDLLQPNVEEITIEDIANNLGKICRFNGQLKQWYSVAEHCVKVSQMVPERYKLQALLHDAAEAYVCDVPTPLKRLLGEKYTEIEERVARAIGVKFGVELVDLPKVVKDADRALVVSERNALQDKPQTWGDEYEATLIYPFFGRACTTPEMATRAYLNVFKEYTK
jgi:hypothetical protein